MPKKPVVLGELKFDSKKEAKEHFSNILNKHPLKTKLSNGEFDDVMSLLLCHPKARVSARINNRALLSIILRID